MQSVHKIPLHPKPGRVFWFVYEKLLLKTEMRAKCLRIAKFPTEQGGRTFPKTLQSI